MSADLERIKKMQEDGKITKEEAARLIRALPGISPNIQKKNGGIFVSSVLYVLGIILIVGLVIGVYLFRKNTLTAKYGIGEVPQEYVARQGTMLFVDNGRKLSLPLLHTDVNGRVDGYLARVTVTQKFVNQFDSTIEAIYTFPLPDNAAVDSMIMTIGNRRIKGIIKERGEARAIYERARSEGRTASLLEQERPNIFTQSVANILKGETILVTISYVQELKFQNGKYTFVFPMVVGPRYISGQGLRPATNGTENPTSQVPDANRITPPIVPPELRSGHDIALKLTINAGTEITGISSPSHKITEQVNADRSHSIAILANDNIPNKDFIAEYTVAKDTISTVMLCHRQNGDGFFQLVMLPKLVSKQEEIFPRELVFVVDNSGSMQGEPLEKCKEVIKLCLENMRSDDLFRVLKFSGSTEELSLTPLMATRENVDRALTYVDAMSGGGGTEMLMAINSIFDIPQSENRRRLILFLTDGYIGNESAILTILRKRLGNSRVFGCGVGSSVNRFLIEGMAVNGRGVSMFMRQGGDAAKTMQDFYSYIDAPVITDIQLKFNGVAVCEIVPDNLPDLFAGQPLVITGKYAGAGNGVLTIIGNLPGKRTYTSTVDVALPAEEIANGVIATLWARKKIAGLELLGSEMSGNIAFTPDSVKEQITKLALTYRIVSTFTSFVAVDEVVRNIFGMWVTKVQAVELPESVYPASQPSYRYRGSNTRGSQCTRAQGNSPSVDKNIVNIGYGGVRVKPEDLLAFRSVDDLINGLMNGDGSSGPGANKRGTIKVSGPEYIKGGPPSGGISKFSITSVVTQNMAALRYVYNKRLREKPDLTGKITLKFAIDEFGKVIYCQVVKSTIKDPELEIAITSKIKFWIFEISKKQCDVTEVVYHFTFTRK
jgi:Ca-activated chloride channel family protein